MPKTPNVMGFSGSVNGTTKNPGFLDFGFCQCKWAYSSVNIGNSMMHTCTCNTNTMHVPDFTNAVQGPVNSHLFT